MSVKVEKLEKNVVKLEITVDAATFEQGMEKSYKKNVQRFNIPGFRKGKAPRKMVEKLYGESVFYEDAINIVCSKAYSDVIDQENIEAVGTPEVDIVQIESGKDLIFTAKVAVKPEVKLGEYKGLKVDKKSIRISNDEVNSELDKMRERNSRITNIENRPVEKDDIAVIDFEGFIDDVPFEGGKGQSYELTIGSGQFIPGFEEQLIGANINDTVDVKVKFPEEYHNSDVAGKDSLFKVKVKGIKVKELPELDDEFAKDVSEFETLEDLKKDVKQKLKEQAEHEQKHEVENELIKIASDNAEIEIPDEMISNQMDNLVKDFDMRLRYQGMDIKKYMDLTGSNIEDFKLTLRPQAVEQVRGRLTLEAIAKEEKIDVTEDELNDEITKLAANYRQNVEEFMKHLRQDDIKHIKEGIIFDKVIELLVENSKKKSSSQKSESKNKETK